MKYAIISDIHSNLEALQAVLKRIDSMDVDEILCPGDIVGYGASPNECVDIVRERASIVLCGNHDHAAVGETSVEFFNPHAKEADLMESCLRDSADAAAVAAKWQTLCGTARSIYTFVLKSFFLQYTLGNIASITRDRFNLSSSLFRVIGIEEDYSENRATVTLWG